MVIFMREKTNNKTDKTAVVTDYYCKVMLCQVITAAALFLLYFIVISPSQKVKDEFIALLNEELWNTYGIIETVKDYFTSEGAWQVSGTNVTFSDVAESTDTTLVGVGGEDIEIYEAAQNTSFAAVRTTVPAVPPVKNGRYTSYFGYRINPITDKFSFHTGLDIAAAEGTNISAAYSGEVTKVGEDSRAGKYVFLTHDNNFVTFYCHCSEILAEEGAVIRQGETIARVGSTGWSTGSHLHFEIRKNNIRYNPIFILENDA